MSKRTAKLVRTLKGYKGDARLYELDPPLEYPDGWGKSAVNLSAKHVVVSAVDVFGWPETFIFPATAQGKVKSWGELDGSFQGSLDHEKALLGAGYTVQS